MCDCIKLIFHDDDFIFIHREDSFLKLLSHFSLHSRFTAPWVFQHGTGIFL